MDEEGLLTIASKSVQLRPYVPRPFKAVEYITDAELMNGVGHTLFVDIENYKNYYLIAFKLHGAAKYHTLEPPFNPQKLSWILHNYKTIGFNSLKYDLPMIWYSYVTQDHRELCQLSDALILEGLWHQQAQQDFKFKIFPTPHIDCIEVAPLKGSLKLYGARLHAPRIQDLPFDLSVPLTEEQKPIVKDYCFNDLDTTELLFDFMKERIELRQAMSAEYGLDLNSKSDAQIAEAVLVKEVAAINGYRPKRPDIAVGTRFNYSPPEYLKFQTPVLQSLLETVKGVTFVIGPTGKVGLPDELKHGVTIGKATYRLGNGGLHSSEENVCYKTDVNLSIVDRDVRSYYPRLTTTLKLYPRALGPAFLIVYERIIQSRFAAKDAGRATEANGKKIVVNGAGGKYSDPYSVLYDPPLTITQNITGQLDLLLAIEMLELCGMQVISANTDGIVTLVRKDQEETYAKCFKHWEQTTGFETEETRYSSYWARDVNSYFAVKLGAKTIKDIKVKGPYSEVGSQSGTQLDTNPTNQICSDAVKHLLLNGTAFEDTIRNCKDFPRFITVRQSKAPGAHKDGYYLGKVVRWYFAKGELGHISTVQANSKVADSDGGKPVMDLPEQFPQDIDYDEYIRRTREMLYDINYLQRPKQISFF